MKHDSAAADGSESENPAIDSPTPKTGGRPHSLKDWWPDMLDLSVLHAHSPAGNPLDPGFSYKEAFAGLDLAELRGYHYHSGVVFDAYCEGVSGAVARGGRYDEVGKAFGRARPATGFSIDLRALTSST